MMNDKPGYEEPILEVVEIDVIIVELVDIEEYAKRGERPPHAHKYRFRVDDHYYAILVPKITIRLVTVKYGSWLCHPKNRLLLSNTSKTGSMRTKPG